MSSIDLKIDPGDLSKLNRKLNKLRSEIPSELSKNISHVAKYIENTAVSEAPFYKGDKYLGGGLKQSIGSEVIGSNAQIFAKKKYAPYQEFGTGRFVDTKEAQAIGIPAAEIKKLYKGKGIKKVNIQPQPFFFPAVRKGLKKLLDDIEVSLKKLV